MVIMKNERTKGENMTVELELSDKGVENLEGLVGLGIINLKLQMDRFEKTKLSEEKKNKAFLSYERQIEELESVRIYLKSLMERKVA